MRQRFQELYLAHAEHREFTLVDFAFIHPAIPGLHAAMPSDPIRLPSDSVVFRPMMFVGIFGSAMGAVPILSVMAPNARGLLGFASGFIDGYQTPKQAG